MLVEAAGLGKLFATMAAGKVLLPGVNRHVLFECRPVGVHSAAIAAGNAPP
jgi:hypothetical protein